MIVVLAIAAVWLASSYAPSISAFWCTIGMLAPAGQPHLFSLPGAYPAVGWTVPTLLVDTAVLIAVSVLVHAVTQLRSETATDEDDKQGTAWRFPSRKAVAVYTIALAAAGVGAGIGIGLQFGWGRTVAIPLILLGVALPAMNPPRRGNSSGDRQDKGVTGPKGRHAGLQRLDQLLASRTGEPLATVVASSVAFGSDDWPLRYTIKSTVVGFFSTAEGKAVLKRLSTEMKGEEWHYTLQTGNDLAEFERPEKKNFPAFAVPHPDMFWRVKSAQEAIDRYPQFKIPLGVDGSGKQVAFSLKDFPHIALVGESGSGKTITLSSMIEFFLSAGWEVALGDGKLVDYGPLRDRVIMVTSTDEEYARLIYWAWEELQSRKTEMQERLDKNISGTGDFPPLLVVLDEFAAVLSRFLERFGKDGVDFIRQLISQLLKEGRQLRVHLIFASQTLRDKEFPRAILDGCPLKISLGPPTDITINQAFKGAAKDRAAYLGGKMAGKKGRALVTITDAPPERALVEYQSWIGYSPSTPDTAYKNFPQHVNKQHRYLKENICGRTKKLYSRQWFAIEGPDDWNNSIEEICELPSVSLDRYDGTPDPGAYAYDPARKEYLGRAKAGKRWGKHVKILDA